MAIQKIRKEQIRDVGSDQIQDGAITDADISASAHIHIDKIGMPAAKIKQSLDINTVQVMAEAVAGRIYIKPIYFSQPVLCHYVIFEVNKVAGRGLVQIALYNDSGAMVLGTTPATPSVGKNQVGVAECRISPGQYYVAMLSTTKHSLYMGNVLAAAVIPMQGFCGAAGQTELPAAIDLAAEVTEAKNAQPWITFST
jgi:hypothetical protein